MSISSDVWMEVHLGLMQSNLKEGSILVEFRFHFIGRHGDEIDCGMGFTSVRFGPESSYDVI